MAAGALSCAVAMQGQTAKSAGAATARRPAEAHSAEPWTKIPIPPLHDFKPVQPRRIELENGLVIFLQEDHELPFIDGSVLIRGGSREEPAAKVGLVSLYAQTWRTSGTATVSGDALDDQLETKAARLETGPGLASTSLGWSSLKGDFDPVFAQAVDLLLHPAFKADKLALAKRQIDTGISRRNDDASGIAGREAQEVVYGRSSPYARQPEYTTVGDVTLDDLNAWHAKTVVPNGMIVSISGDFQGAAMEAKLRAAFSGLKKAAVIETSKLDFAGSKTGVYFVDKNDVNQSNVYIAGLGTERSNPDFYALSVMNEIFSGGFGSRVFQNVRTKLGLAYSVDGGFGASYDHPGMFLVGAATKSESTVAAVKAVLDEIGRLKTQPPSPAEMKNAKDQVLNSFIFHYDSPDKTLTEQVRLAFYGYPSDYLEKFKAGIERVTAADVSRVAEKYIKPQELAVVVVGNEAEMKTPLSQLGKVTTVDVTIPPPPDGARGVHP